MASGPARKLNRAQNDCLAWLVRHEGADPGSCSDTVLAQLMKLGLIEKVDLVWLPLEMKRAYYRVTKRGRAALED